MRPATIATLFYFCTAHLLPLCYAQTITVRVVNATSGKPLKDRTLAFASADDVRVVEHVGTRRTNAEGIATFDVAGVHLPWVFISDGYWACDNGKFRIEEILEQGIVAENRCDQKKKLKQTFVAKPGELIMFIKPARWWQGQW